jgi:SAM-dependent methyltransferase
VAALFAPCDIPLEERLRSDQIQEAFKLGWRYIKRSSGGHWLKDGVRFVHMHNYILEVFDHGQYKDLDVKGKVIVDVGAGFGETTIYFLERGAKFVVAFEPCPGMFREMLTKRPPRQSYSYQRWHLERERPPCITMPEAHEGSADIV